MNNLVWKVTEKGQSAQLVSQELAALKPGYARVRLSHSAINYKDALALTGQGGVVRQYPAIAGIDGVGVVSECDDAQWLDQDVIITGFDFGVSDTGGLATVADVPCSWLVKRPTQLRPERAAALGTAGVTAAMSVLIIKDKIKSGKVLVTGANGGVAGIAIALLHALGYQVIAASSRPELLTLPADIEVISNAEVETERALSVQRWQAVVDCVGGTVLSGALASCAEQGVVTCCGLAQSPQLNTTVMPFILRGVSLFGIDSVHASHELRHAVWQLLAQYDQHIQQLQNCREFKQQQALDVAQQLLAHQFQGRAVICLGN